MPGEPSVAGFDDIFGAELIVPALTTVRAQLVVEAGERAVESILRQLDGLAEPEHRPELATELVVRGSTGSPPRFPTPDS